MSDDRICLSKERADSTVFDHFFGQLLDGPGKTTGMEFLLEFVLPCLDGEPVISRFWVSQPENFGGALEGCSAQVVGNSGPRT